VPRYSKPKLTDPVLFGDVFVADYLFDAWLAEDTVQLGSYRAAGGGIGYSAAAARDEEDYLLARGRRPIAALLVSDDCYIQRVFDPAQVETRLHFAPVFALADNETERHRQLSTGAYSQFPLPPDKFFQSGGVAELNCPFGFDVTQTTTADSLCQVRVAQLTAKPVQLLETRWGAHASRRGALVASTTRRKLAGLLRSTKEGQAAAEAVAKLLSATWSHEGAIIDRVDIAAEKSESLDVFVGELITRVEGIQVQSENAAAALRALGTPPPD
jgi:hypothetical protein